MHPNLIQTIQFEGYTPVQITNLKITKNRYCLWILFYHIVSITDGEPHFSCQSKMPIDKEHEEKESYAQKEVDEISEQQVYRF